MQVKKCHSGVCVSRFQDVNVNRNHVTRTQKRTEVVLKKKKKLFRWFQLYIGYTDGFLSKALRGANVLIVQDQF